MSTYRLVDDGYPTFKKIVHGKKWVGRVVKTASGKFYGRINNASGPATEYYADSEIAAFEGVVSRQLGHPDVESLRLHNSRVRRANKEARAKAFAEMDRESGGALSLLKTLNQMLRSK